jgi:hypothetical protein
MNASFGCARIIWNGMKRSVFCSLALCLFALIATPQETWKGLKFGMTVAEAQKILDGYTMERFPEADELSTIAHRLTPDYILDGQEYKISLHFEPRLLFGKDTGKLEKVELKLKLEWPSDMNWLSFLVIASKEIYAQLKNKYGTPTEEQGLCPLDSARIVHGGNLAAHNCDATWRSSGQVIDMGQGLYIYPDSQKTTALFFISYQHVHTDL